jgi:hypothetical protein
MAHHNRGPRPTLSQLSTKEQSFWLFKLKPVALTVQVYTARGFYGKQPHEAREAQPKL